MQNSFKDKVIMITGASSGIGAGLARAFAKEGGRIALLARRVDRLQQLSQEITQLGAQALPLRTDVTQDTDLPEAVKQIQQTFGELDVVVANAGFGVMGNVENLSLADFQRQFETNVWGVMRTVYAALPSLKKTKGRLVIIGSVVSHISTPQYCAYAMSKHALTALADNLFFELAPYGISVTFICPGFVKTEIREINNYGQYQEDAREPLPDWIRLNADKAAEIIVKATRHRERERIITIHGKLAVFLQRSFPGLIPRFFRWQIMRRWRASHN